ncbi:MAG: M14 family zinc carboxypeptidase, partial [Melioribacteraceae bacterium]
MKIIIILLLILTAVVNAQLITPIEKNNYTKLTSYDELFDFVNQSTLANSYIEMSPIAVTNAGYIIPALFISSDKFGEDKTKVRVMVFAQQHGNEQSGKEGMLLLLKEIANGKHNRFFDKIDLILIPQVNPEGSEANKRRNSVAADLNRNHLILTMPETTGLHRVFNKYLPVVTLDIHEYYPYSEEWEKLGYRKNFDEQIGIITNINVSQKIRDEQRNNFLPYIFTYIRTAGFTANEYLLGGPPGLDRMRYSTVDIDDGRQSLGILNSFSLIFEGLNGIDSLSNMNRRANGQKTAVLGLLQYIYENAFSIKSLVKEERESLINGNENYCAIQMEHFSTKDSKDITFYSVRTDRDTV